MDVRVYFQKIRQLEASIAEPYVIVVSRATPDGGKPGLMTEVARSLAAKLIVEEQATRATPEETAEFRTESERLRMEAEGIEPASPKKQKRQ